MASMTPKPRALQRPSYGGIGSAASPNSFAKSVSTFDHRKASYNALTGQAPNTPSHHPTDVDLRIGDVVNVPGDMYGTVKFLGNVRGKDGQFLGVELDPQFSGRGKNDGDVDGVHYFHTTVPGSGIFLPVHRAQRRSSSPGVESMLGSPGTPSRSAISPIKTSKPKLAQSVGPGARPSSPFRQSRTARPSLPRPESPVRRNAPNLHPTPATSTTRQFSKSVRSGTLPPGSPAPGRTATPAKKPSTAAPPPRPYSRTSSRLGQHSESASDSFNGRASTSLRHGTVPSFSHPLRSPSRLASTNEDDEAAELRRQIAEKDRQIEEQTIALQGVETSFAELQALMAADPSAAASLGDPDVQRSLREKDEKYEALKADFDANRADFKGTIDAMEAGIAETERMYEERNAKYEAEIRELQAAKANNEDYESMDAIATQLKGLEELVAELEEGLEDARRGEAEARSEVEHLRGEVERTKSELRRAKDQAAGPDGVAESSPLVRSPPALGLRSPDAATRNGHGDGQEQTLPTRSVVSAARQDAALEQESVTADNSPLAEKSKAASATAPDSKKPWCAMCEKDGHFAYDCPEESY